MAKVNTKKEKKEKELKNETKKGKNSVSSKNENEQKTNIKIYEKYTCFVVGIIAILLFVSVLKNPIFIPALLITIALELFCIAYYYLEDKDKKKLVYGLFIVGVILVFVAIIYTILNTI